MVTPSSARIIQDVNLTLKALGIVYHGNGDVVADGNGNKWKMVGEGGSVS